MAKKNLTILHSNDIHGDFLTEEIDHNIVGGLSLLSGYLRKTRAEEDGVIYAIAGDMFNGSIIDSEYLGFSTIEMMNMLFPDVVTPGNHEVDYGMAHLLFLEKCARFPIINANLKVNTTDVRMFHPYRIVEKNGLKVMFIGIITEEVLDSTRSERIVGSVVGVDDAAREIGIICDAYKTTDVDYTVLLTHIGINKDAELAALIRPEWGIDLIIGGHTHTFMDKPLVVNGIPIIQAGTGTNQLGRLDLCFDTETRRVEKFDWKMVPIDDRHCAYDPVIEEVVEEYRTRTERKYKRIVTNFVRTLTHPTRYAETELGDLFADVMVEGASFDIMFLGSGSLRRKELGPIVSLQDLKEFFPFDDSLNMVEVTGEQMKRMVAYIFREEAFSGDHTEFYQFSRGCRFVWSRGKQEFEEFSFRGKTIRPEKRYRLGLQDYHFRNFESFFGIPLEEVTENLKPRIVGSSCYGIYEELLSGMSNLDAHVEGRIVIRE